MFRDGIIGRSICYAVPAVQRKLVQTVRALFRGTVRDKAMGGRRKREEKLSPFPQMGEYQSQPTWKNVSSLSR